MEARPVSMRWVWTIVAAVALLAALALLFWGGMVAMCPGCVGVVGPFGFVGGWLMMFLMFLFWTLILGGGILLLVWLVNQIRFGGRPSGEAALEILKERYARGEISREEFEDKKRDLESG